MSSSTDPLGIVGQLISNKYRVLAYVVEGGFSVVYRAQHELWNAPVALKCFRIDDAVQGRQREELVENFLQEGQLMASLSTRCAAIAQARDVGTCTSPDGRLVPFLVLEWLEGRTLDAVLELEHASGTPARSLPEAMAILEPVAVWGDTPGDQTFMNAAGSEFNAWETAHGMKPTPVMFTADDGFVGTAPVGSFPKGKTRYGLVDMIGNVWEWTDDWYATYKPDEVTNPKGAPAGERKAIRGGGFNGGELLCLNPAFRYHQLATASSPGIGMRCVKTL